MITTKHDNAHLLEGPPREPRNKQEMHCWRCVGYGYRPRETTDISGMRAVRCEVCDGVGLIQRTWK